MSILVIAQDGQLRDALERQFTLRERPYLCVGADWLATEPLPAIPEGIRFVVNVCSRELLERHLDVALAGQVARLADVCATTGLTLLQLSSTQVYDGLDGGVHREQEEPVAASRVGALLIQMEDTVRQRCERHVILRTGPMFSSIGDNLLTRLIKEFESGSRLALSDTGKSCPMHASDMARVVSAIIDQLDCGADCWGTFHYSSADFVTHYRFAEALQSALSQYRGEPDPPALLEAVDSADTCWPMPLLNCTRILNTFGIKQLPWRAFLAPTVKKLLDPESEPAEPVTSQSIPSVQKENFDE